MGVQSSPLLLPVISTLSRACLSGRDEYQKGGPYIVGQWPARHNDLPHRSGEIGLYLANPMLKAKVAPTFRALSGVHVGFVKNGARRLPL
jgi:hypothetical protein